MTRFHAGELSVQQLAGVADRAARVGNSIHRTIPEAAAHFVANRPWIVIATAGEDGRPWASLLRGAPGFVRARDEHTLTIAATPQSGDPLERTMATSRFAGVLAIDLATRRRVRLNGTLHRDPDGALRVEADQVYANCPKSIHPRPDPAAGPANQPRSSAASALSERQRDWIRGADTFFIGTLHPDSGADASHRGGPGGFVSVTGDRLVWPDFAGNMMYNTLGNIAAHPWAGLLFVDFATGALLMVSGRAGIVWDPAAVSQVPGAERLVELEVDAVVELG